MRTAPNTEECAALDAGHRVAIEADITKISPAAAGVSFFGPAAGPKNSSRSKKNNFLNAKSHNSQIELNPSTEARSHKPRRSKVTSSESSTS